MDPEWTSFVQDVEGTRFDEAVAAAVVKLFTENATTKSHSLGGLAGADIASMTGYEKLSWPMKALAKRLASVQTIASSTNKRARVHAAPATVHNVATPQAQSVPPHMLGTVGR